MLVYVPLKTAVPIGAAALPLGSPVTIGPVDIGVVIGREYHVYVGRALPSVVEGRFAEVEIRVGTDEEPVPVMAGSTEILEYSDSDSIEELEISVAV